MSKAIKDKMDKLDTLSGGIVFGKEEAWERLQGKLEQKPVRRIPLGYRIGAALAAVLLVVVCISALYNKTEDKIAAAPSLNQYETSSTTPSMPAAKDNAAGIVSHAPTEAVPLKHRVRAVTQTAPVFSQPEPALAIVVEAQAVAVNDLPSPTPATVIAPVAKPAMRVIHINEIDEELQRPSYASAKPALKDMKVVTELEEWDGDRDAVIQRNNRPHGTSPFFTLPGRNNSTTTQSLSVASNPFNIKLSIQN